MCGIFMNSVAAGLLSAAMYGVFVGAEDTSKGGVSRLAQMRNDTIPEAVVHGGRPLVDAGIFKTGIDSSALKENISTSVAELLSYNTSVFIRQSGRASLSTISLRGTSPSHTKTLWNGMKIDSPMLGMTDFSMIPAFLMDSATIFEGASSVQETSGGLGGAILLETRLPENEGFGLGYIQGLGSWLTADEFLKISYGGKRFSTSTGVILSTSRNNFRFINMDKKEIAYDENMQIVDSWHPVERNENGEYRDLHIMQELGWKTGRRGRARLSAWYLDSWRELPPMTVNYGSPEDYINEQREKTLRAVLSWTGNWDACHLRIQAGWAGTYLAYDYAVDNGTGRMDSMTASRSRTGSLQMKAEMSRYFGDRWLLTAMAEGRREHIRSADESALTADGTPQGYDAARTGISVAASVKWKATDSFSLSLTLREDMEDKVFSPPVPAFNAEYLVWSNWDFRIKAAASLNHRFPTLNDLYFQPGGNPDLRPESGISYDIGYSLSRTFLNCLDIFAEGGWSDSYIKDWIAWMPEGAKKNFWTPVNVMTVHAYGIGQSLKAGWTFAKDWELGLNGNFRWSPSIDSSRSGNSADKSFGKQLPYIPEFAASFTARLSFREWSVLWKWCWYSRRFTASDNSESVPPYIMNDLSLDRRIKFRKLDLAVGAEIRNLFDERYVSVISRPMPGINFEIFLSVTPHFSRK